MFYLNIIIVKQQFKYLYDYQLYNYEIIAEQFLQKYYIFAYFNMAILIELYQVVGYQHAKYSPTLTLF